MLLHDVSYCFHCIRHAAVWAAMYGVAVFSFPFPFLMLVHLLGAQNLFVPAALKFKSVIPRNRDEREQPRHRSAVAAATHSSSVPVWQRIGPVVIFGAVGHTLRRCLLGRKFLRRSCCIRLSMSRCEAEGENTPSSGQHKCHRQARESG